MQSISPGAELLDELHDALILYVVLPSPEAAVAVALWIAATHAQPAWQHATRFRITSPLKRCGKTRLLDVIERTCHKPVPFVDATIPAIFRSISKANPPTLIIDEADAIFSQKNADRTEDLRKLLNAGFSRNRGALRVVGAGTNQKTKVFPTFAMVAIAGIGDLPETITDRAVNITMRRRGKDEKVSQFRERRDTPGLHAIRDQLAAWVAPLVDTLREAEPELPVEDRAADVWEPLVAIADEAGGEWPKRAREACKKLCGEANTADVERSYSLQLLTDLRVIFGVDDKMSGQDILQLLHKMEPWSDWYGRRFNQRDLAGMLGDYGIHPVNVKVADRVLKGYKRDHLIEKGWTPYLEPLEKTCPDWKRCTVNPNCVNFKVCCDQEK